MKKIVPITIILLSLLHWQVKLANTFAQDTFRSIDKVIDWGYQLQGYFPGLVSIRDSKFDLVVMDYSFSGEPEEEFSKETIESLKSDGSCASKIILAYMSIGEAREFRFYFENMPKDLLFDEPNPDSLDKTKVRFWRPEWQKIIFGSQDKGPDKSYLDRIIDAGFDGVYLDIIDAYEFWGPVDMGGNGERNTAAKDMVDFVVKIAEYAKNIRGKTDFIIVPQNGAGIIDPYSYPFADDPESEANTQKKRYLLAIDAIGAENTFYSGNMEDDNPLNIQSKTIKLLNIFRNSGKKVFAVDYVHIEDKVDSFYSLAEKEGYIPYATVRGLDTLIINSMHEPVCNKTFTVPPASSVTVPNPSIAPTDSTPAILKQDVTPTPTPIPLPADGKKFIFSCEKELFGKLGNIEVISLGVGETIGCKLVVHQGLVNKTDGRIEVATQLKTGNKVSIQVDPTVGITNAAGELDIALTAIENGIDWIAWAIARDDGVSEFSKEAFDSGNAWGIFVVVK